MRKNSNIYSNAYLEKIMLSSLIKFKLSLNSKKLRGENCVRLSLINNENKYSEKETLILQDSFQDIDLKQTRKNVSMSYFNGGFDKKRLKSLISWSLKNCGEKITIDLLESLKNIGFRYATQAGISLGIDDLKIPLTKKNVISDAEIQIQLTQVHHEQAYLTGIEKFQQLIDAWHRTSETLKQNVIQYFKSTDIFNPVYMMAFSGARGNISQVRQLVGMRGLMSDPQGEIIDFPIKSNFREGLTLTEYIISCYGARKGLVDTALKTANSGYLTRRLVDVSHHIIVCDFDCKTQRGIILNTIFENEKIIASLQNRLIGRLLAENIYSGKTYTGFTNEISDPYSHEAPLSNVRSLQKGEESGDKFALFYKTNTKKERIKNFQVRTLDKKFQRAFNSNKHDITQIRKNQTKVSVLFYNVAYNYFFYIQTYLKQEKREFFQNSMQLCLSSTNFTEELPKFYLTEWSESNLAQIFLKFKNFFFTEAKRNFKKLVKIDKEYSKYTNKFVFRLKQTYLFALKYDLIAPRNTEISPNLAAKIATLKNQVLVRSPLTCEIKDSVCQLCYGWSLAHGKLVSLGEAVGIIAAQSIGEPGTQLTMRTFHTGGVFSGDIMNEILSPFHGRVEFQEALQGVLIRTSHGKIAFLTKVSGEFKIQRTENLNLLLSNSQLKMADFPRCFATQRSKGPYKKNNSNKNIRFTETEKNFKIPPLTILFVRNHEYVTKSQIIAEFSSVSTETSQRIRANYDLKTQIQGEVYFKPVYVKLQFKKKKFSRTTTKLGNIWILSGKIYKPYLPVNIFPQPGDLIDENSLIGEYQSISPYNGFTTIKLNLAQRRERISRTKIIPLSNWKYISFNNAKIKKNNKDKFSKQNLSPFGKSGRNKGKSPGVNKLSTNSISWLKKSANANFINKASLYSQIFLNHTILFFPIQCIQYKKIGYFFSFFQSLPFSNSKKIPPISVSQPPKLIRSNPIVDRFFISNSLQQEFSNLSKLQKNFYLISFPKQFQTTSGGLLTYDNLFLNKKFSCGEIFWIAEETYTFNLSIIILVNAPLGPLLRKPAFADFPSKATGGSSLPNNLINMKKSKKIPVRLNKWTMKTNSISFHHTKQGKISNFFSKLYGYSEIFLPNLFHHYITHNSNNASLITANNLFFGPLLVKSAKANFTRKTKSNGSVNFYFQFHTIGFKINPVLFAHEIKKCNLQFAQTNFVLNLKKNKNSILLKNNQIAVLKPQFPTSLGWSIPWCNETSQKFHFGFYFQNKNQPLFQISQLTGRNLKLNSDFPQSVLSKQNQKKNKIIVKIKSGWTYFPFTDTILKLKKNVCFIKPSKKFFHTILFDQYPVYVEFLFFAPETRLQLKKQVKTKIIFSKIKSIQKKNTNLKKVLNFSSIYHEFYGKRIRYENFHFNNDLYKNGIYIIKNNTISPIPILKQKTPVSNKVLNFDTVTTRYISFEKNKNNFIPKFFVLIRKVKSYSFLSSRYYKKLLAQQNYFNRTSVISSTKLNKSFSSVSHLSQCNKQYITHLFFNLPTPDFSVIPHFQFKKYTKIKNSISKKNSSAHLITVANADTNFIYILKNSTILKFYIQFSIPRNYPINAAKIKLIPKLTRISVFSSIPKKLPIEYSSQLESLIKKNNTLFFNSILYFNVSVFRELKFSNFLFNKTQNRPHAETKLVKFSQNFISPETAVGFTTLFSPYKGEIIHIARDTRLPQFSVSNIPNHENTREQLTEMSQNQSGYHEKQKWLILTNLDQISFSRINLPTTFSSEPGCKLSSQIKTNGLKSTMKSKVFLGECVRYGTKLYENLAIPESGRIIQIEKSKITLRKAQSILFTSEGLLSVYQGDLIEKNSLILRLFYYRLQTGDIVQGIPKIEQLFEARKTNKGEILLSGIHHELHRLFHYYSHKINMNGSKQFTFEQAARKSLEKIQQSIVRNVQKVYQSQGVTIAEKHFEIIVREMTSKVEIISSGKTNFIAGELVDLDYIQDVNKSIECEDHKVRYQPIILGITQKSLNTKSFISEASFQETTRILTKSAMEGSTDFLKGLKENVIFGKLIPAGTGFSNKMFNLNKLSHSTAIKKNFSSEAILQETFLLPNESKTFNRKASPLNVKDKFNIQKETIPSNLQSGKAEILKEFFFKQNYIVFQEKVFKKST